MLAAAMLARPIRSGMALALSAACACSSAPSATATGTGATDAGAAPRVFVGTVAGTDAQVAVVATPTHARLYFCGGDASYMTKTHWIPSAAISGSELAPLPADSEGWTVDGHLDDGGASGTVVMGSAGSFSFQAVPAVSRTIAGLYEAEGPCGKVGVVVSQSSPAATPAIQGACLGTTGSGMPSVEQVNPIMPVARAGDGSIAVLVGSTQILVRAAAAPAD